MKLFVFLPSSVFGNIFPQNNPAEKNQFSLNVYSRMQIHNAEPNLEITQIPDNLEY